MVRRGVSIQEATRRDNENESVATRGHNEEVGDRSVVHVFVPKVVHGIDEPILRVSHFYL